MRSFDTVHFFTVTIVFSSSKFLSTWALHVVPGSNCTALCSSQDSFFDTTINDITCNDDDYDSTVVGQAFKSCVSCEVKSESFDPATLQTDLAWALCRFKKVQNSNHPL